MARPFDLGNFQFPKSLLKESIGPPTQIAYYSCFPGATNKYEYQSRKALKVFKHPEFLPYELTEGFDKSSWREKSNEEDSHSRLQQGVKPAIEACKQAGYDLHGVQIIANRGSIVEYPLFPR